MNEEELVVETFGKETSEEETFEEETSEEETSEEETSEEEASEEEASEENSVMETIDYDRLETMIESANEKAGLDTSLNSLAVTDVLMIVLAIVLGIIIVRGHE